MKKVSAIASQLVPPFESCSGCDNGWVFVREDVLSDFGYVQRCHCWLAHQERIKSAVQRVKEKA
jgi:hypothetical protein